MAVFLINVILAFVRKQRAAANPWGEGATIQDNFNSLGVSF